jgi:hypothetical protein
MVMVRILTAVVEEEVMMCWGSLSLHTTSLLMRLQIHRLFLIGSARYVGREGTQATAAAELVLQIVVLAQVQNQ